MTPLPWVQLMPGLPGAKDWWVDVYGPLDKEQSTLEPSVITQVDLRLKSKHYGVSTSLEFIDSCPVLLNRLYLCHDQRPSPFNKQHIKHRLHLENSDPSRFLRRICLQFSDIILIYSDTILKADQEIAIWADCQENNSRTLPKFLILQDMNQSEIFPHMSLTRTIKQAIDCRKEGRHLWNLKTLIYLWEKTCQVIARTDQGKVNFAMMLSECYWPGNSISQYSLLRHWLHLGKSKHDLQTFILPTLAELFIRNSQDMGHRML
jgi:hypothetical protein